MNRRKEEIKERIAKRKRERVLNASSTSSSKESRRTVRVEDENVVYPPPPYSHEASQKGIHPLFRTDLFIMKLLIASCLVLIVAIIHKNNEPPFQKAQETVKNLMETEFQFAAVSKWYEEQFGDPIAILSPLSNEKSATEGLQYAVPASGKVLESFKDNGQGITVETTNKQVEAMNEGFVIEVGKMEDTGLTVILQHADGTETWYGNLKDVNVALYDFVELGETIGQVNQSDKDQGTYYFAIKKGDQFIDPIQVITFE